MQLTFQKQICSPDDLVQFEFFVHVDYNDLSEPYVYSHPNFKLTVTLKCSSILPKEELKKILGTFNDYPMFRKAFPQEIILEPGQIQFANLGEVYDP